MCEYFKYISVYQLISLMLDTKRYSLFPIIYPDAFAFYKKAVASFWTVDEIDFSKDRAHFEAMNAEEKRFITMVLAFFASSDGIVNENLALNYYNHYDNAEIRAFLTMQLAIETIHSEAYALQIEELVCDINEKAKLFEAINYFPSVALKANWALRYIENATNQAERLIAFVIVEGMFFAASFCAIYWFKGRNVLPGVSLANDLISRDETLHYEFGTYLYLNHIHPSERLSQRAVHKIFLDAFTCEAQFVKDLLPIGVAGMNKELLIEYVKYISNRLLVGLHYEPLFPDVVTCPVEYMTMISLQTKENFFERKVSEYNKMVTTNPSSNEANLSFDF